MSQEQNTDLVNLWRELCQQVVKVMPTNIDNPVQWTENFIKTAVSERVAMFSQEESGE